MAQVRHRVFVSYHHDDQNEVDDFVRTFADERHVFIARALGVDMEQDIIDSDDTEYVMRRVRELYLKNSTVTIVLIGRCTWARRYVDWEIQSSLRHGTTVTANGLVGITLPSAANRSSRQPPNRLSLNLKGDNNADGYARWYKYPTRRDTLANCIDDAFRARTARANLIVSPRDSFSYNRQCP